MEEEAAGVARGNALTTGGRPNGACYPDLGADLAEAIREERYSPTCLAIAPEPPRPFAFVREEVPLHEVIRADGRRNSTRLRLLAAASMRYGDP